MITYTPDSTVIKKVSWDSETEILCVLFNSNSIWFYFSVEPDVFYDLTQAKSVGRYFNKNIRNVYRSHKFTTVSEMEEFFAEKEQKTQQA